jgi:membrane-bound serine protease (ClpP class)
MTRLVRVGLALALLAVAAAGADDPKQPLVVVGRVDTPIHPASALYLQKLIRSAEEDHAVLVVVGLSTPGGLGTSMREMTTTILLSKVPVATFVSPAGSQSASAGFFLLLAGDVAAMAPGTNTGAAHPVGSGGEDLPKVMNEKAEQDTQALIRTIAAQRGRNADKAETAVSQSRSFTDTEAKEAVGINPSQTFSGSSRQALVRRGPAALRLRDASNNARCHRSSCWASFHTGVAAITSF